MILLMDNLPDLQQLTSYQQNPPSSFKLFLSKNKFTIIFISILGIVSLGMTGYLLASNSKPPLPDQVSQESIAQNFTIAPAPENEIPTQPPLTPAPTIAPINPTASWSAFVSSAYSYSIKYPPNWTAQTIAQTDPKILEYVVFNPVATKSGTLSITLSYGTRTYQQALALDPQTGEIITVASASATKKNSKDSNEFKAVNVIVPFGANTIIFNAKEVHLNLFNRMLTTLKLTR